MHTISVIIVIRGVLVNRTGWVDDKARFKVENICKRIIWDKLEV